MFRTLVLNSSVAVALCAIAAAQTPAGPHQSAPQPRPIWHSPAPPPVIAPASFCFGDGSAAACPCSNTGLAGRGCENSALSGGALLWTHGVAKLSADTLELNVTGELQRSLSIVLQGNAAIRPANFGDGLRCVGGALKRPYATNAIGGMVSVPGAGELSVSARSEALGDPIKNGETRYYQVYYRDPSARFCATPNGGTFNVSNGLAITWGN